MSGTAPPPSSQDLGLVDTQSIPTLNVDAAHAAATAVPPPPSMQEAIVFAGRYEVKGVLGGGAMGTVYRARDRALDENVALKLLKKELAVSPDLVERFRREVKLARRVTHRNVARVYDIGAQGQQPFLTMELIDGVSLAEIVSRRGKLPPSEVHATAAAVCAGLAAAHGAGVVHRDLKPENVLVEHSGRAVITDFGVACALTERELPFGAGGALVGSPAYMAPEQVEGIADIDARADLYALGVMLYELLTGDTPWEGGTVFAIAAARLVREPPDPRSVVSDIPSAFAQIVMKCMARKRDDRFRNVEEVVGAFAKSTAPPPTISIPPPRMYVGKRTSGRTLAVLPLVNGLGPDASYFTRGYVAEMVDLLGNLPGIQVRQASPPGPGEGVREIGRSLGAHATVTGSLDATLTGVRLSVRLVTVEDGLMLWSRRVEASSLVELSIAAREHAASMGKVLDAHDDAVSTDLKLSVAPHDPQATDLHMRGRFAYQRAWFEANEEAVSLLEMACVLAPLDPGIAATLALALARAYGTGGGGEPAAQRARDLAERALSSSPQLADARVAIAALHAYDGEGVAAAGELRRALASTPDAIEALDWMGRLLIEVGDTERGLAYLDRAYGLDPAMIVSRLTATLGRALVGDWNRVMQDFAIVPADPFDRTMYWIYRARAALWRDETALVLPDLSDLPPSGAGSIMAMFQIIGMRRIEPHVRSLLEQMLPTAHSATVAPRRAVLNAQLRAELLAHAGLMAEAVAAICDADAVGLADIVWLERCPTIAPLRAQPDVQRIQRNVSARATRIRSALGSRPETGAMRAKSV